MSMLMTQHALNQAQQSEQPAAQEVDPEQLAAERQEMEARIAEMQASDDPAVAQQGQMMAAMMDVTDGLLDENGGLNIVELLKDMANGDIGSDFLNPEKMLAGLDNMMDGPGGPMAMFMGAMGMEGAEPGTTPAPAPEGPAATVTAAAEPPAPGPSLV